MQEKVWKFGTEFKVTVISSHKSIISVHAESINEGFLLMGHGMTNLPKVGDKGKIIFEIGGPKGGYWKYYREETKNQK